MKTVIGLVGEKGAGKDTFTKMLQFVISDFGQMASQFRSSDVLADTLRIWGISVTRENLQKLAQKMREGFGDDVISSVLYRRLRESEARIVVFNGVRWQSDVQMLRKFPDSLLVYVTARPEVRFERVKARKEKEGEGELTYEQFLAEEQASTETEIAKIGKRADVVIENNGGATEFQRAVEDFWNVHLKEVRMG